MRNKQLTHRTPTILMKKKEYGKYAKVNTINYVVP